jgi:hypothetical protein
MIILPGLSALVARCGTQPPFSAWYKECKLHPAAVKSVFAARCVVARNRTRSRNAALFVLRAAEFG